MIPCENLFLEVQALRDDTIWFILDEDSLNGPAVLAPNDWEESKYFKWFKVNRSYHNLPETDNQFPYTYASAADKYAQFNDDSSITLYYRPQESVGNTCRDGVDNFVCTGLDNGGTGDQLQYSLTLKRKGLGKDEEGIPEWETQKGEGLYQIFGWEQDFAGTTYPNGIAAGDDQFPKYALGRDPDNPTNDPANPNADANIIVDETWPDQFNSFVPGWDIRYKADEDDPSIIYSLGTPRSLLKDMPELEEEDNNINFNRNHPEYMGDYPVYWEPPLLFVDGEYKRWEDLHNNGFPLVVRTTQYWTETYMFLPEDTIVPEVFAQPAYQPQLSPLQTNDQPILQSGPNNVFTLSTTTYAPYGEIPEYQNVNITMICDNPENPEVEVRELVYEESVNNFNYRWQATIPTNTNAMQLVVDWEFGESSGRIIEDYLVIWEAGDPGQTPEAVLPGFDNYVRSTNPEIWFGNQLEDRTQRVLDNYGDGDTGGIWEFLPNFATTVMSGGYLNTPGDVDWLARYKPGSPAITEHPWLGSYYDDVDDCLKNGPLGPQPPAGSGSTLYFHFKGPRVNVGPLQWYTDENLTDYINGEPLDHSFLGYYEFDHAHTNEETVNENGEPLNQMATCRAVQRRLGPDFRNVNEFSDVQYVARMGYHTLVISVDQSFQVSNVCDPDASVNIFWYDWSGDTEFREFMKMPQSFLYLEDVWTSEDTELLAFGSWQREMTIEEVTDVLLKRTLPADPTQQPKTPEEIEAWFESVRPTAFQLGDSPSGQYTLVLNLSPLDGEVDLLEGVGAPEKGFEWVDVLTDTSQINIDRGFDIDQGVLGVPFVGTMVATIQDTNLDIAATKEIKIASTVRLRAGNTIVYTGILNALEYDWNPGKSPVLFLESWDGVALLNSALMRERTYEKYDERIKAAAAALGLPVRVYQMPDGGEYRDLTPVDDALTGLQQVTRALDSEGSAAWVDRNGMLNATTREWYKNAIGATAAPLVLGNTMDFTENPHVMGGYANAYCLSDFTYENSTRKVINGLTLANETEEEDTGLDENGSPVVTKNGVRTNYDFRDENSERIYGTASIRLNTNLPDDTGALSEYADYIFNTFGLPRERIRNVEFPVDRFEDLTIPDEISLDIGENVDIFIQAPDGRVVMDKIHVISQVRHRITPTEWLMQLELI